MILRIQPSAQRESENQARRQKMRSEWDLQLPEQLIFDSKRGSLRRFVIHPPDRGRESLALAIVLLAKHCR